MSDDKPFTLKTYRRSEEMRFNARVKDNESGQSRMMKVHSEAGLDDVVDALQRCWDEHGHEYLEDVNHDEQVIRDKVNRRLPSVDRDDIFVTHRLHGDKTLVMISVDGEHNVVEGDEHRRVAMENAIDAIVDKLE
jgi:hypothetical protein